MADSKMQPNTADKSLLECIPVTAEDGIDILKCTESTLWKDWFLNLQKQLLWKVRGIHIQSVDMFGKRVGFMKIKADIIHSITKQPIPGICFLRGGSVAILIIIECEGTEYVILTSQARVPIGQSDCREIPAGMLDGDGNFAGVAAKELKEETGLEINSDKLFNLTALSGNTAVYPSPGGCDEFIRIYLYKCTMTADELQELNGRITGNTDEGESIIIKLIKYEDLYTIPDCKALSAYAMYEGLKKNNIFT